MIYTYHMIDPKTREVVCVFQARTVAEAARTYAFLDGYCRYRVKAVS